MKKLLVISFLLFIGKIGFSQNDAQFISQTTIKFIIMSLKQLTNLITKIKAFGVLNTQK